jgi:hypothetical protein
MSALQTTAGEDICHADVIDAVKREMLDARRVGTGPRAAGGAASCSPTSHIGRPLPERPPRAPRRAAARARPGDGVAW